MTCHYNGSGGGALNDYGRSVFNSEIAQNSLFTSDTEEEKTSDGDIESNVFFNKDLKKRLKPGFKYRGLFIQTDPGTDRAINRFINMQGDFNMTYIADPEQSKIIVASIGYAPTPKSNNGSSDQRKNLTSHEYYLRWQYNPHVWIYAGFMDKTFGIKTPDHTAFSRSKTGLGQNDQSHGFIFQYADENFEVFINPFFGNLFQDKKLRQQGLGALYEYQPADKMRLGCGGIISKNDFVIEKRAEVHTRVGLEKGNSLLFELGLIENSPSNPSSITTPKSLGSYSLMQGLLLIKKGLHLSSIGEHYKADLSSRETDQFKWHFGFLYFPRQGVEFRTELLNSKALAPDRVTDSTWALQAQLHLFL